jgi:hypothetical protein
MIQSNINTTNAFGFSTSHLYTVVISLCNIYKYISTSVGEGDDVRRTIELTQARDE